MAEEKVTKVFRSADTKLMSEIERKASSENKTDIIESLDLFEKNLDNLPYRPAHEFITNMRDNPDSEIKEKVERIYINSFKEIDDKLINDMEEFRKSFYSNVAPIQSQMKALSQSFKISKEMADTVRKVQLMQHKSYELPKLNSDLQELMKSYSVLNDNIKKNILNAYTAIKPINIEYSPILRAENLFSRMPTKELEKKKPLSAILEKTESDIAEDIRFISEQNKDFTFNYPAYMLLCNLENYFRYLIQQLIIEPNGKNLPNKIPTEIIKKWEERKQTEESNPIVDSGYGLIYYSDFTDIKDILKKGRNYELFNKIYTQEQLNLIISKLHELDPIRKKIAHNRPLSESEFYRLRMYSYDILQNKDPN